MGLFAIKKRDNPSIPDGLQVALAGQAVLAQAMPEFTVALKNLISVTHEVYSILYQDILCRFAEFCQAIPVEKNAKPYSLLNRQLNLALAALKLRQGMLLSKEPNTDIEIIAEQEGKWTFAVFSTALLHQLHEIQQQWQVQLYHQKGQSKRLWQPLTGSFYQADTYFTIEWKTFTDIAPASLLSALIIHLIPQRVMHWLAEDSPLFICWWKAITDPQADNPLVDIILKALATIKIELLSIPKLVAVSESEEVVDIDNTDDETTTQPVFIKSIAKLTNWLAAHSQRTDLKFKPLFFRLKQGLTVHEKAITLFLQEVLNNELTIEQFIDLIKEALFKKDDHYRHTFCPTEYANRYVFQGIVIQETYLPEICLKQPLSTDYQFNISI